MDAGFQDFQDFQDAGFKLQELKFKIQNYAFLCLLPRASARGQERTNETTGFNPKSFRRWCAVTVGLKLVAINQGVWSEAGNAPHCLEKHGVALASLAMAALCRSCTNKFP